MIFNRGQLQLMAETSSPITSLGLEDNLEL